MVYPLAIPQNTSLATSKSQSPPRNKANWKRKKSIVPVPATLVVSRLVLRGYGLASSPQLHRGASWQIIQQGGPSYHPSLCWEVPQNPMATLIICRIQCPWLCHGQNVVVVDCGHPTIMHDMNGYGILILAIRIPQSMGANNLEIVEETISTSPLASWKHPLPPPGWVGMVSMARFCPSSPSLMPS